MHKTTLNKLQRVLRINILLGLFISLFAGFMIFTNQYEGVTSSQPAETLLSWIGITALLYTLGFWFACLFKQQLFRRINH